MEFFNSAVDVLKTLVVKKCQQDKKDAHER